MIRWLILQLGNVYSLIIVAYCILSWIPEPRNAVFGDIKRFVAMVTEPYLGLFRKLIPPIGGAIDITPIIALFVLQLVVSLVARLF